MVETNVKKVVVISDTHNTQDHIHIPECDFLIHCGDATTYGTYEEHRKFFEWFSKQKARHKIYVPGNHDSLMENFQRETINGIHVLKGRSIELDEIKIYGTPFFSRPKRILVEERTRFDSFRILYERALNEIKIEDCDILITHSPPNGILDLVEGTRRGCEVLGELTQKVDFKVHLFGHIHSGYGKFTLEDRTFLNAALCNDENELIKEPIVFNLNERNVEIT